MNTKDIRNALKARLAGGAVGTETWPNVDAGSSVRPRLETTFAGISQTGGTLKGDEVQYEDGTFMVMAIIDQGGGEDAGLDLADSVAALFPEGLRLTITGGTIAMMARPDIRAGYPTDTDYRIPIAIRYRARNT